MRTSHNPGADIRGLVRDHFGIVGEATPLGGYSDSISRIETSHGESYVLHLSSAESDAEELLQAEDVMKAASVASFSVPHTVPTTRNETLDILSDGRIARLHTWVQGSTYAELGHPPSAAMSIGRTAGEMVQILATTQPRTSRTGHRWDLQNAQATIRALRGHLATEKQLSLVQAILDRLLTIETDDLPLQMVHNDLNPGNLLLSRDAVGGVIDFDDATRTYRISELAIACAYVMLDQEDPVSVAVEACRGYLEFTEPTAAEAARLVDLILARLAVSVCISASQSEGNPAHHDTEAAAWDLIARLINGDTDATCTEIEKAARGQSTSTFPVEELMARRDIFGSSLSLSYGEPLSISYGDKQYLFDTRGRRYLDCVNNVAHVGHGNPRVTEAATSQTRVLNTNTRYLHPNIIRYAERLTQTLPEHLNTVFLVNSGSEANELAIRLARTATGRHDIVCIDHAYHGNTTTLIDVSPYKFSGPGGAGRRPWVRVLPSMDPYRTPDYDGPDAASVYLADATEILDGCTPAALIVEALPGCGGHVVPASGVLGAAYESVRLIGGLVIADEVQTGLGRVGTAFWAFQLHGVDPDIVTIGKPAGNGHPLAVVVTTRSVAAAFDNGMEYFNTFGGNPVSGAVGNAVLDVIEDLDLQHNALTVGGMLVNQLRDLALTETSIGDVRGAGLFIGIELVTDRRSREPAPDLATAVVEFAKNDGVLLSIDGPHHNVIKIKPPMIFTLANAARITRTVRSALAAAEVDQ